MLLNTPRTRVLGSCAAALALLAACDAGDYTYTPEAAAEAAKQPSLNFSSEVSAATRTCLSALERKATASPDLSPLGYSVSSGGTYSKTGPKTSFGMPRDTISVSYSPARLNRTTNRCGIRVQGLGENTAQRGVQPQEAAVIDAAYSAAQASGFKARPQPNARPGTSEILLKGATTVSVLARTRYEYGLRTVNFTFSSEK